MLSMCSLHTIALATVRSAVSLEIKRPGGKKIKAGIKPREDSARPKEQVEMVKECLAL